MYYHVSGSNSTFWGDIIFILNRTFRMLWLAPKLVHDFFIGLSSCSEITYFWILIFLYFPERYLLCPRGYGPVANRLFYLLVSQPRLRIDVLVLETRWTERGNSQLFKTPKIIDFDKLFKKLQKIMWWSLMMKNAKLLTCMRSWYTRVY